MKIKRAVCFTRAFGGKSSFLIDFFNFFLMGLRKTLNLKPKLLSTFENAYQDGATLNQKMPGK